MLHLRLHILCCLDPLIILAGLWPLPWDTHFSSFCLLSIHVAFVDALAVSQVSAMWLSGFGLVWNDFCGYDLMLLSQIVRQRWISCCCRTRWDGAERAIRRHQFLQPAGKWKRKCATQIFSSHTSNSISLLTLVTPSYSFPPVSLSPLSHVCLQSQMLVWPGALKVVSTTCLISITPVIFQLDRRLPSCHSVTWLSCPVVQVLFMSEIMIFVLVQNKFVTLFF